MRVLRKWAAAGLLCALSGAAFAAPHALAADKPMLYAGTYAADPPHSKVMFISSHLGLSVFLARFDDYTTQLTIDPTDFAHSSLKVTVKPASVDIDMPAFAKEMEKPAWFDTAKYPEMTFVSTKFTQVTPSAGKVTGNLTIKGVTHPLTLDVRLVGAGINPLANVPAFGIEARGIIKRSDYGMTADIPLIPDEVKIWINAEFEQQKQG